MNHFIFKISLLAGLNLLAFAYDCQEGNYANFLNTYNRLHEFYQRPDGYEARFKQFCVNMQMYQDVNNLNLSYKLGVNQRTDTPDELYPTLFQVGTVLQDVQNMAGTQNLNLVSVGATPVSVPSSVDYRTSGDVSAIKNQGSCGCCWSFTTVGLYQSWMMYKGENQYDLSEQYILECTSNYTKNVLKNDKQLSSCQGGYVDYAGDLVRINGVPLQSKYPYLGATYTGSGTPTTPGICQANQTYLYAQDPTKTSFQINSNLTSDQMKQLIANGPIGALIYANSQLSAYTSGIFTGCGTSFSFSAGKINHAVIIVGYDSAGNYIIKNSWGTGWGVNGFGTISKDADCALSANVFQYVSSASPGTGLLYKNQVNLNYEKYMQLSLYIIIFISFAALMF